MEYRIGFYLPDGSGPDTLGYASAPAAYASPSLTPSLYDFNFTTHAEGAGSLHFKLSKKEQFFDSLLAGTPKFLLSVEVRKEGGPWVEPKNARFMLEEIESQEGEEIVSIKATGIGALLDFFPFPFNEVSDVLEGPVMQSDDKIFFDSDTFSLQEYMDEALNSASTLFGLPFFLSSLTDSAGAKYAPFGASVDSSLGDTFRAMNPNASRLRSYWQGYSLCTEEIDFSQQAHAFAFTKKPTGFGPHTLSQREKMCYSGYSTLTAFFTPSAVAYDWVSLSTIPDDFYLAKRVKPLRALGGAPLNTSLAATEVAGGFIDAPEKPLENTSIFLVDASRSSDDFLPFLGYEPGLLYSTETADGFKNLRMASLTLTESKGSLFALVVLGRPVNEPLSDIIDSIDSLKGGRNFQI